MSEKSKRLTIIILLIVTVAIMISGLVTAFIFNYNTSSPAEILIMDDGQNIYVTTSMNDNYSSYRFTFKNGDEEVIIDSKSNVLTQQDLLENDLKYGETYRITCQYISAYNQGSSSEKSEEISWTMQGYLDIPQAYVTQDQTQIVWQEVEYADYYIIHLKGDTYDYSFRPTENSFDLSQVRGDNFHISITAFCNSANIFTSPTFETHFQYYNYFSPFESVRYDVATKTLFCQSEDRLDQINVEINGVLYNQSEFLLTEDGDNFIYSIDLKVFTGIFSVGASPCNEDQYNLYTGEVVYANF